MTPGEIHGLHKQVVDDLKAQLAAARDDARNERTRAEAAEQELREHNRQREIEKRVLWSAWEWFDDHDDRKASAEIYHELQQVVGEWHGRVVDESGIATYGAAGLAAKLAAIRAHLPALKRLHAWVSSDNMGKWTYLEGGNFYDDVQEMTAIVADALEALEP